MSKISNLFELVASNLDKEFCKLRANQKKRRELPIEILFDLFETVDGILAETLADNREFHIASTLNWVFFQYYRWNRNDTSIPSKIELKQLVSGIELHRGEHMLSDSETDEIIAFLNSGKT